MTKQSKSRPDTLWALALTTAAILATWFAVEVWNYPPDRSGIVIAGAIAFAVFAWFGAVCEWWRVVGGPEHDPTPAFRRDRAGPG